MDAPCILVRYPRASLTVLDMLGHNLQIEQPDIFYRLVNESLERTEERRDRT